MFAARSVILSPVEPQEYCQDVIRRSADYAALAVALAPPEHRSIVQALAALRSELIAVPLIEDTSVAQIKLSWWENELAECRAGRPRHPITLALAAAVPRDVIETLSTDELCAGLRREINGEFDVSTLDAWLLAAESVGGELSLLESGCLTGDVDSVATRRLGGLRHAAWWLLSGRRGWCSAPADDRARLQVSAAMLEADRPEPATESLRKALREILATRIDEIMAGAVAGRIGVSPPTIVGTRLTLSMLPPGHRQTGLGQAPHLIRALMAGWRSTRQAAKTRWQRSFNP